MNAQKGNRKRAIGWVCAAAVLVALAGVSGVVVAKELSRQSTKDKSKTEAPGTESGNGYIGVYMQDLTADVRKGLDLKVDKGVLVSGVEEDSPADKAGIEDGDVIVRFNGSAVSSPDDLRAAVRAVAPGQSAKVDIVHEGDSRTVTVTVSERPEPESGTWPSFNEDEDFAPRVFTHNFAMSGPRLGVEAHDLEDDGLASYFGARKGDGILVLSVDDESVAGKAGVKPGDIISKVGNDKIEDTRDIRDALKNYNQGDQFDITVMRHGKAQSLKATMDDQDRDVSIRVPRYDKYLEHFAPRGAPMTPRVYVSPRVQDDMRRELDDLKQQVQELKEQLNQRNDG